MSIKLMSACWDMEGLSPTQKLVLISLADQANDTGVCWPSIATIARRCSLSERAVQTAIISLQDLGVIKKNERSGRSTLYTITPAGAAPPQELHPAAGAPTPAGAAPPPPQELHPTPAGAAPRTVKESSLEPPKKRKRKKSVVTKVPEDFVPNEKHHQIAREAGVSIDYEKETFIDYWLARGEKKADWNAAFRNWLRRSAEFRNKVKVQEQKQTGFVPFNQ